MTRTTNYRSLSILLAAAFTLTLTPSALRGAAITWDGGAGAGNEQWSNAANFGGTAAAGNDITFDDTASTTTGLGVGHVTNIVDTSLSIGKLTFLNDDGNALAPAGGGQADSRAAQPPKFHTTQINASETLTVTDTLTIGQSNATGNAFIGTRVAMVDGGGAGTLTFDNASENIEIDPESSWFQNPHVVELDLSALSNFNVTANAVEVGVAGATTATLRLAGNNDITANIVRAGSGGWGTTARIQLGETNTINADLLDVAGTNQDPQHNGTTGIIEFQSGLGTPGVTFRDQTGSGRVPTVRIGLGGRVNSSGTGRVLLSGGLVDALFDQVDIGIGFNASNGTGELTFDDGTIDAVTMRVGSSGEGSGNGSGNGTVAIAGPGATLVVGTMTIADQQGTGNAVGTVNLSGGTLQAENILKGTGGGSATINFVSGTIANKAGTDLLISSGMTLDILTAGTHNFSADAGQTITVNSDVTGGITGDVNKLGDGTLLLAGSSNSYFADTVVQAGTLGGFGSPNSSVTVEDGGTVAPGLSPGIFAADDFDLQSGSTLQIEIGGLNAGSEHDQLLAGGDVVLDGTLQVNLIDGFSPDFIDSFVIIEANSVSGQFENVEFGVGFFQVTITGTQVLLSQFQVPEPSSFALCLVGLVGSAFARRRRRC